MLKEDYFVQKSISIDAAKSEAKTWTLCSSKTRQEMLRKGEADEIVLQKIFQFFLENLCVTNIHQDKIDTNMHLKQALILINQ